MTRFTATHKALLAGGAVVAFGLAAVLTATPNGQPGTEEKKGGPSDHTMFGGTPARNMVNTVDKNVPDKINPAAPTWKSALGSRAYGGPIIAHGKVFVGTNNELPRNKRDFDKAGDP